LKVFVLDKHNKPLMPCSLYRVHLLLRRGRAVVHKLHPFVIRLKDRTAPEGYGTLSRRFGGRLISGICLIIPRPPSAPAT
jgi:RRXRR protein